VCSSDRRFAGSVGLAFAEDDDVGDLHGSTVGRVALRAHPGAGVSVGFRAARGVGGSLAAEPGGQIGVDGSVTRRLGDVDVALAAGVAHGALWRYAETRNAFGFGGLATVASRLSLGVGVCRYTTAFGAERYEWERSVTAALRVASVRVAARYTSSRIGAGSGYGVSIGYEPLNGR